MFIPYLRGPGTLARMESGAMRLERTAGRVGGFGVFGPMTEGAFLPRTAEELAKMTQVHARAAQIARSAKFLKAAGLANDAAAQEAFFGLLDTANPALSRMGGAAGYLKIGDSRQLRLALATNSADFAIRHELLHFAREAIYRTKHGQSLFLQEMNGSLATKLKLLFREEGVVWWQTFR
jgi:hypothetical protein